MGVRASSSRGPSPYTSMVLEHGGSAHIAYYLPTTFGKRLPPDAGLSLRYEPTISELRHAAERAGAWAIETVDADGNFGGEVSIAVDDGGAAHVSYHEVNAGQLRYATNESGTWSTEVVANIDSGTPDPVYSSSLELGSTGTAFIVYVDNRSNSLRVASRSK